MAEVHLRRYSGKPGQLPAVCVRCGAPAVAWQRWHLSTTSLWSELWGWLVCLTPVWMWTFLDAADPAPTAKLVGVTWVPLCKWHRHYRLWRSLILYGGYVVFLAWLLALAFMLPKPQQKPALVAFGGFLLVWVPLAVFLWLTGIRVKETGNNLLLMCGISPKFRDAVQRQQFLQEAEDFVGNARPAEEDNPFAGLTS
jgi:hypothetical protein